MHNTAAIVMAISMLVGGSWALATCLDSCAKNAKNGILIPA